MLYRFYKIFSSCFIQFAGKVYPPEVSVITGFITSAENPNITILKLNQQGLMTASLVCITQNLYHTHTHNIFSQTKAAAQISLLHYCILHQTWQRV